VRTQIENQQPAAGFENACGLGQGRRRLTRVVQGLRQQRHIHHAIVQWQRFQLALLPGDVRQPLTRGERFGAVEHAGGAVHGHHAPRPARGFDRQITLAAAEVGDVKRRKQQTERARPGRPAAARHQLPSITRIGAHMLEILAAQPQHFLQARFVGLHRRRPGSLGELPLEHGPQGTLAVIPNAGRQPVEAVRTVPLFDHQPGLFQQAQVPRDPGLRQAENAGQLLDVEAVLLEDAQQPKPGLIAEQAIEGGRVFHIYQCR